MSRIKYYSFYFCLGAFSYWLPDILIQWIRPPHKIWIILLTFFVPLIVAVIWYKLHDRKVYSLHRIGFPIFMLIGIWIIAPLAIAIGMIPAGGNFFESDQIGNLLTFISFFPIATVSMSTYSGSFGGIILVSLFLIAASISGQENKSNSK